MNKLWQWIRGYLAPNTPFKLTALILLLVVAIAGAAPGYLKGNWRWSWVGPVANLSDLREIRKEGIDIPSWETVEQGERLIGSRTWSSQRIRPISEDGDKETENRDAEEKTDGVAAGASDGGADEQGSDKSDGGDAEANAGRGRDSSDDRVMQVMLLPTSSSSDQPQVEWSDWEGVAQITTDSERFVDLQATSGKQRATFTVRLLRGWTANNTTLVMAQWYAWPGGGSPKAGDWFWADRGSQVRRLRLPWVAVNIVTETKRPLDELQDYQDLLINTAIDVQT
ncbi:MAG: cyanoexosortase B system-associated protein, partial [Cyanobacteria bacterium P01_F01_bin.153]